MPKLNPYSTRRALVSIAVALSFCFFCEVAFIRATVPMPAEDRLELWAFAAVVLAAVGALAAMAAFVDREGGDRPRPVRAG